MAPVMTRPAITAFDMLYAGAMPDPKPDDPIVQEQTDLLTQVMPLSELVLVTIFVVALLIVAVMLYPA